MLQKQTLTVHFYLSTHPSEKLVFALSGVMEASIHSQVKVKKSWAPGIPTLLIHLVNLLRWQRGSLDGVVA